MRPRVPTARVSLAGCRSQISRTPSHSSRAATSRARTRSRSCGAARAACDPRRRVPVGPVARRCVQRTRGRARAARRTGGRRLAERRPSTTQSVSRRAPLTARAGALELHDALVDQAAALVRHAGATRTALATDYTSSSGTADDRRPPVPGVRLPGASRRRPGARLARGSGRASREPAECGLALVARSRATRRAAGLRRNRRARQDAAWQADVYLELLATLAIAATHQSQLGQDFEIYASQEFGLVELSDAHSRASALMPQKKNPYALAAIRTQAGQAPATSRARSPLCTPGRRGRITSTCSTAPFHERSTRRSRSPS